MKTKLLFSIITITILFAATEILYSYANGVSGRTRKSTTSGCSCHNGSVNTGLPVVISGPDSVVAGSTTSFTLTVTSATGSKAGLDVAVRNGTLATNQSGTKLLSGELVQSTGKSFTSGAASFTFNYVAPSSPVVDTLYSIGLASAGGQNGSWNWFEKRVKVYVVSGVEPNSNIVPDKYSLKQNFPNPFNPSTTIVYSIKNSGKVNLKVYDSKGRVVSELVNANQNKGEYKVDFDASSLASGVYYYTLNTKEFTETKSMVLIK
ncbi:MAG: T9SS type A sorting domain-containing protein [Bacteroidetes bacterium]|nr:T9SS type A sorting domain-containing protein [Bacteroidota bacterium]